MVLTFTVRPLGGCGLPQTREMTILPMLYRQKRVLSLRAKQSWWFAEKIMCAPVQKRSFSLKSLPVE